MTRKRLLEFEDFYRALVSSTDPQERNDLLRSTLIEHHWKVSIDDFGAPLIEIETRRTHVEDAYRIFSRNEAFYSSFL
jgi:hypothetical protein